MRMNSTNYKQYDTRWATLGYPKKPWYIRNCGCGEVAICNAIIRMATQQSQTPKTIQPYMKQFAEPRGNGTYHSGIPTAMKHYGMTDVKEHATMSKLWAEMAKGNRICILLMGSRLAGSKKVKWTGSGHFVAGIGYKEQNGKHYLYVVDSASTSTLRNGWLTYEDNIKGACLKCWSGKLSGTVTNISAPAVKEDGKLTVDGIGGKSTVTRLQAFLGTPQDGVITGQNQAYAKYHPALKSVKYGKGGSTCVRYLQKWLGITQDGIWGAGTSKALQKKLGVSQDSIFGAGSMKALQKYLNANSKAVYPTKSVQDRACEWGEKIASDNSWVYVVRNTSNKKTYECPICHNHAKGKYHGWNCIGFVGACYHHGAGIPISCANNGILTTAFADKMLKSSNATSVWESRNGKGWAVIKNGYKVLPTSMLKRGDIVICFNKTGSSASYKHVALYLGNGKIVDATKTHGISVRNYSSLGTKPLLAVRYK